jgi:cobalt-zinc-cadmium efflux system outer membrane protein
VRRAFSTCAICLLYSLPLYAQPLRLEDVLDSVRRHYPPLLAALQERPAAEADVLSAEGRFDVTLRGRWDQDSLGYYSNQRWDFAVDQPLAWNGMSLGGGYRVGEGSFAPYDGKLDTRSLGEWRSGIRLPLLRDRAIDSRRAELAKARIGIQLAGLSIEQQRLAILLAASQRYWNWVAAGRRLALAKAVLKIAEDRQTLLDTGVNAGQLPAIDAADNRRAILQRQGQVVEAERSLQQASIELSLFLRDDRGEPRLAASDQQPEAFPVPENLSEAKITEDEEKALERRPDLPRLAAQRDATSIDAAVARNQALPAMDLVSTFTTEHGSGVVRRGPQELRAGVLFELPVQRRAAKGRERAAEVRLEQIRQRDRFTRDQIRAEVRDAGSFARTAYERQRLAAEEVVVSRQLETAERTRFELGDGTLFQLNLREQATVESVLREIASQADYQRAVAAYRFATAAF